MRLTPDLRHPIYVAARIGCLILGSLLFALPACSPPGTDDSLSGAVSEFIEYRTSENYDALWSSSSERFRNANDDDREGYERYAKSYGVHPARVDVLDIRRSPTEAIARVRSHYVESSGKNAGSAVEEWKFVSENGRWYFDGSRTESESAD